MELLFGFTPPRERLSEEKMVRSAERLSHRVNELAPDKLIIYDIQDESERNPDPRPFPFSATKEPLAYARAMMQFTKIPMILYKCVVKCNETQFSSWMDAVDAESQVWGVVLVGGQSSKTAEAGVSLKKAYEIYHSKERAVQLGAVAIAERHIEKHDEHERMIRKMQRGVEFFVSQAVYHPTITERLFTDLTYACAFYKYDFPLIYMTLTPCGSAVGFDFMEWLGIYVSERARRVILASRDPVRTSSIVVKQMADDILTKFPNHPIGVNVESVSKRSAEITGAIYLAMSFKEE